MLPKIACAFSVSLSRVQVTERLGRQSEVPSAPSPLVPRYASRKPAGELSSGKIGERGARREDSALWHALGAQCTPRGIVTFSYGNREAAR